MLFVGDDWAEDHHDRHSTNAFPPVCGHASAREKVKPPMSTRHFLVLGAFALLAVGACSAQAPPPHAGTGTTTTQHTTPSDAPTTGEAPGPATKQPSHPEFCQAATVAVSVLWCAQAVCSL